MPNHSEVYNSYFGYEKGDYRPSEITGKPGTDIHHIDARGMGGRRSADAIENLICLTREEHVFFGDIKKYKDWLRRVHNHFTETRIPWADKYPKCGILREFLLRDFHFS